MREFLAPTKYAAALWAVAFLVIVACWCLWFSVRIGKLLRRMRLEDRALWAELGSPDSWSDLSRSAKLLTFRRLRADPGFAQQFNQHVVHEIRELQRQVTVALVAMASAGLFVVYLVWPHR